MGKAKTVLVVGDSPDVLHQLGAPERADR